jgi:hypothetical protein
MAIFVSRPPIRVDGVLVVLILLYPEVAYQPKINDIDCSTYSY